MRKVRFQRIVQTLSLLLFIGLLWAAAFPLASFLPVDAFLRMDPLAALGVQITERAVISALWPGAVILVLTFVLGRFFCGMVCPMGATIDLADRVLSSKATIADETDARYKRLKYQLLFGLLGASLVGVSFVFLVSPLSLITRFYGLVLNGMVSALAHMGLQAVRPLAISWDFPSLAYAQVALPRFALQWFTVIMLIGIFAGIKIAPRFWCRCLCPAGAAMALCSRSPVMRRTVSDECIDCGKCQKKCPVDAIGESPFQTDHGECIACQTCVDVCPVSAIQFKAGRTGEGEGRCFQQKRRQLVISAAAGAGTALVTMTGLGWRRNDLTPGQIHPPELIRPPGALPERSFLNRCIRCGECMKACPTNTLQPIGLVAGVDAFFSPVITPRRGACEPLCNVCGQVCPTGAIRAISSEEKIWAKVGTAQILRQKCLAWEMDRKCLVCDEVCPYNAIDLKMVPEAKVPVPFVDENRCSGCGLCEHHCPVQAEAAIVVEPMAALRLSEGSYAKKGREMGLRLSIHGKKAPETASDGGGYGFETPDKKSGGKTSLPPGFTD